MTILILRRRLGIYYRVVKKKPSITNILSREGGGSESTSTNNNSSDGAQTIINQDNSQNTHIVFADNQQSPKKRTGVLRIPSPREFEQGKYAQCVALNVGILTC